MTMRPIVFDRVTKRYASTAALDDVSFDVSTPSIVALVGANGSGKTTLLNHVVGLALPTAGTVTTLGCVTSRLGATELGRIGVVYQRSQLTGWMTIDRLLRYVSSFYDRWDSGLETTLLDTLGLDRTMPVSRLSPGGMQKLAIVVASCHRPSLLLLDEPLSDLDPEARLTVMRVLLDAFNQDEITIVLASHLLHDLETIVERVLVLAAGRLVADSPLDDLREQYVEWRVTSLEGRLPKRWAEPYVRAVVGDQYQAAMVVHEPERHLPMFRAAYNVEPESRPLSLDRIVSIVGRGDSAGQGAGAPGGVDASSAQGAR